MPTKPLWSPNHSKIRAPLAALGEPLHLARAGGAGPEVRRDGDARDLGERQRLVEEAGIADAVLEQWR